MGRDIIDVYDRSIFEMRNVFTTEECKMFIDYHEQSPNKHRGGLISGASTTESYDGNIKRSIDVNLNNTQHIAFKKYIEGVKKVSKEYKRHIRDINRECGMRIDDTEGFTYPKIQRTGKGDFFNWHSDYCKERLIAVIIYLNDIDEENGGSTEFNSGRKVQPETGKVLMFPTTDLHLHRGNTILNGPSKYILSGFIIVPDIVLEKQLTERVGVPFIFK
tara:strand:- start:64 stop:717 length:654 start_codon:yes stop_codon:yes gene_type:complete